MTTLGNHRSIVVGIDGTRAAVGAARWAGALAARQHFPLVLLTAVPTQHYRLTRHAQAEAALLPALRAAARRKVDEAATEVRRDQPDVEIRQHVVDGIPERQLVEVSASARMVIVAATLRSKFTTLMLGSTALHVATKAKCPVAVWRGNRENPLPDQRPVLVGVDGSPDSEAAVGQAFELAALLGVGIIAVHAWNDPDLLRWTPAPDAWPTLADQEKELLAERLAGWCEKFPDLEVTRVVQKGTATEVLLEHAADAQMMITGGHGHNRLIGLLIGSTSQNLLHNAPCPIIICRDHT